MKQRMVDVLTTIVKERIVIFKSPKSEGSKDCIIVAHGGMLAFTTPKNFALKKDTDFAVPEGEILQGNPMRVFSTLNPVANNIKNAREDGLAQGKIQSMSLKEGQMCRNYSLKKFLGDHSGPNMPEILKVSHQTVEAELSELKKNFLDSQMDKFGKGSMVTDFWCPHVVSIRNRSIEKADKTIELKTVMDTVLEEIEEIDKFFCYFCRVDYSRNPFLSVVARLRAHN